MKDNIIGIVCFILMIFMLYFITQFGKSVSYAFFYEDMVRDTVYEILEARNE